MRIDPGWIGGLLSSRPGGGSPSRGLLTRSITAAARSQGAVAAHDLGAPLPRGGDPDDAGFEGGDPESPGHSRPGPARSALLAAAALLPVAVVAWASSTLLGGLG